MGRRRGGREGGGDGDFSGRFCRRVGSVMLLNRRGERGM